jgi:hypothetical protein
MASHVIKFEYDDGKKLQRPVTWCGSDEFGWMFQDAQHVALSVGGSVQPCKKCVRAIINELQKEL